MVTRREGNAEKWALTSGYYQGVRIIEISLAAPLAASVTRQVPQRRPPYIGTLISPSCLADWLVLTLTGGSFCLFPLW